MIARGEFDLMANRSDRGLSTLAYVRAHLREAVEMIRDSDPRISIMATGATLSPDQQAVYMTATVLFHPHFTSCTWAGSIYDG